MLFFGGAKKIEKVTLRAEGVDRNIAGVIAVDPDVGVTLRAEGVDRNV